MARDRVRTSVRPCIAALPEAAGRDGDFDRGHLVGVEFDRHRRRTLDRHAGRAGKAGVVQRDPEAAGDWIAKRIVEEGKGLSANDFTNDLKGKLDAIEAGAQVNVIENVSMNGEALVIAEKGVNIPLATNTTVGVIKGSDVENGVVINAEGAASVKNLNVEKLVQTDGDWLILNGGNSTLTV